MTKQKMGGPCLLLDAAPPNSHLMIKQYPNWTLTRSARRFERPGTWFWQQTLWILGYAWLTFPVAARRLMVLWNIAVMYFLARPQLFARVALLLFGRMWATMLALISSELGACSWFFWGLARVLFVHGDGEHPTCGPGRFGRLWLSAP